MQSDSNTARTRRSLDFDQPTELITNPIPDGHQSADRDVNYPIILTYPPFLQRFLGEIQ